jgi:putative SOS response-associated peptidase YedK
MEHKEEITRTRMERAQRANGTAPEFATSSVTDTHHFPGAKRAAQLNPRLNSGSDVDLQNHARGRRGLVVRKHPLTGERHLDELVWGLLPHGTKNPTTAPRPINARAETVANHPMFADAFRERRGIVPATVYYQRRTTGGSGQSFAISRNDGRPMAFAGLWEAFKWPNGDITPSYCIITTDANSLVAPIHDRMPVVLEEEDWPVWLGERPGDVSALLRTPASHALQCQPVRGKARTAGRRSTRSRRPHSSPTLAF